MRSSIDTGRAGKAVSYPGIDPRLWLSLAVVEELGVDPANGVYANVRLLPSGDKETCVIGSGYAGKGFGAWLPLSAGDLVLLGLPRGDAAEGPVLVTRLWSGSHEPPAELGASNGADPPSSPVVVVGPGQTVDRKSVV